MNLRFVFSLIVSLLSLLPTAAQDLTRNWIRERIFLDAEGKECVTSVQYFDGIGRETLLLTDGLSPGGGVAGVLTGESFAGRTSAKWLPATGLTGFDFLTPERVKSLAVSSHEGDSVPFSLTRRDALGRVSSVRNAGGDLAGKAQLSGYTVNRTYAPVKRYCVDASGKLASRGLWREGALRGVLTSDEDGISTEVFSDLRGRKVLERRNGNNDTYFVYDDAGRLSFVLTPGMQEDSNLLKHAYEYRYDRRSECVYSRIPGCEPVEMHRDTVGRTAVVRDGVLRKKGRSRFILYDRFGRTAVQGTCNGFPDAPKHAAAEAAPDISNGFENTGYSFKGISFSGIKIEQVFYYDDYLFLLSPAVAECRESGFLNVSSPNPAKGFQTGSITAVSGGGFVYNALYYTPEGRLSVSKTVYPSGEKLSERTEYTFTGSPRHRVFALSHGGLTDSVSVFYGYGSNGALVSKDLLVNGHDSRRVASLSYDALGRVVGNTLPGKAGRIAYSRNIRNLVTEVEGKGYKGITAYTPGRFNGSPSSATDIYSPAPQTGASGTDTTRWRFSYDALGRLTEAEAVSGDRKHTETTAFDANGNITRLVRWADYAPMLNTAADVLYYTLDGNRPLSISDRGVSLAYAGAFDFKNRGRSGEYAYDGNGRLVSDPYKGMTVTYADWGTPEKITFDDGNHTAFTYTASGEKLKTEWRSGAANLRAGEGSPAVQAAVINSEELFGPFVCRDGRLDKFLFDGGFCDLSSGVAKYRYFVRDRLGSVRSVADEDGNVLQQNLYYARGGAWGDVCTAPGFQSYKYCGKYLDRKHGLDLYDYGARLYDPAAAFWTSPDPLCEKYYNISPYAFCNNNPVTFIDPDGRDWYKDTDNTFQYDINIHSQKSLTNGQKYIGKSFSHKGASFRSDGSILYKNETMAYNRLWSQANNHYRTNIEKEGRETSAFILKDGEVLVMPEYKNDDSTSQIELYGYNVKGNVLTKHNEIFEIVGQIHTHQNRGLPSSPSYYLDSGYGDLRLSINMHGAPVFTIGHNGMIYGIRGKWNNIESEYNLYIMNLTPTQKSRRNLLLGKTKITEIIKHFKPLQ